MGSDYDTATEFTISNEDELRAFSDMVNKGKDFSGKTVKLADNITMSERTGFRLVVAKVTAVHVLLAFLTVTIL